MPPKKKPKQAVFDYRGPQPWMLNEDRIDAAALASKLNFPDHTDIMSIEPPQSAATIPNKPSSGKRKASEAELYYQDSRFAELANYPFGLDEKAYVRLRDGHADVTDEEGESYCREEDLELRRVERRKRDEQEMFLGMENFEKNEKKLAEDRAGRKKKDRPKKGKGKEKEKLNGAQSMQNPTAMGGYKGVRLQRGWNGERESDRQKTLMAFNIEEDRNAAEAYQRKLSDASTTKATPRRKDSSTDRCRDPDYSGLSKEEKIQAMGKHLEDGYRELDQRGRKEFEGYCLDFDSFMEQNTKEVKEKIMGKVWDLDAIRAEAWREQEARRRPSLIVKLKLGRSVRSKGNSEDGQKWGEGEA